MEEDLKKRAAQRTEADLKGELKSEGNDWLEKKAEEEIHEYKAKLQTTAETIKKMEGNRKLLVSSKEDKEKWAANQKKNSQERERRLQKRTAKASGSPKDPNIYVVVMCPDGTKETLYVRPTDKVNDIRETLQRKKFISKEKLSLKFMGRELENYNSSLSDYNIYNPEPGTDELLDWCQEVLSTYELPILDFQKSWKDGIAFAGLVHRHREDLVGEWKEILNATPEVRLLTAFSAFESMGVNMIMEVEDVMSMAILDRLSTITFLGELRNRMSHFLVLGQK